MIDWIEAPVFTLFDQVTLTRVVLIVAAASLILGWLALRKRRQPLVWYLLGLGGFVLAYAAIKSIIPGSQPPPAGEAPSASYTIWSSAKFRSDLGLVLILAVVIGLLVFVTRRAMRVVNRHALDRHGDEYPPAPAWQILAGTVGGALWLVIPLIIWVWTALWLVTVGDYSKIILPLLGFVGVFILSAALWYRLEGTRRSLALLALIVLVLAFQFQFNQSRKSESLLQASEAVPMFIPLIPVILGVLVGRALRQTLPERQYALLGWRLGNLFWLTVLIGFLVKFLGYYNYQSSYAFAVGAVLDAPLRMLHALVRLYYDVLPGEIADEQNAAKMDQWRAGLAALAGFVVWGLVLRSLLRQRTLADEERVSLSERVERLLGIQLSFKQRRYLLAIGLLLPALALRTFTTFYPFLQTLALGLQKYNPAFPPRRYLALRNFERLSNDLVVRESLEFTLIFVFVSTLFQVILGVAIAHLLNAKFRLRGMARTISLIPWAIPMVVAAMGFRWMFDDQFGMFPDLLRRFFSYETTWLINPQNARVAIVSVAIWKSTPFVALLLLAGLQGISQDMYEAAKVDGANWVDTLRFITVPMLLPIIVTTTMFMLVWQLAVFDLPFAMTGGGPGFSTTVIAQKIYLEINALNYSTASALSIMLVILVAMIGGLGMYIFRRVEVAQ